MALLSADDVLNKRFQQTKFREGYDQDEVDDFLDEVVNTLRAVYAENDELKAKLQAAEERLAEVASGAPVDAAPVAEPAPAQQPEQYAQFAQPEPAQPVAAPAGESAESVTSMIMLAQKLHDDYVNQGQEEAERLVTEARANGEQIVRDAEQTREQTLQQLESERGVLERKIDELRTFERDTRERLKNYLEGLLTDVQQKGQAQ